MRLACFFFVFDVLLSALSESNNKCVIIMTMNSGVFIWITRGRHWRLAEEGWLNILFGFVINKAWAVSARRDVLVLLRTRQGCAITAVNEDI